MKHRLKPILVFTACVLICGYTASIAIGEASKAHQVAIHVDENDPKRMNLALNNAQNIIKYYDSKGESVKIEIVANGPGLHMLRADTSAVKDRIETMNRGHDHVTFSACGNTHRNMSKKAGKRIALLPEATLVPSGVVRLMELQEQGWSYIRP